MAKAYQELVDIGLLQKRRGLGMFVTEGARSGLTHREQQRFIDEELPAFAERARTLGLRLEDVVDLLLRTGGEA